MKLANKRYLKITELYAFISVDPADGSEGLIGALAQEQGVIVWMPFISCDEERFNALKEKADEIAKETGIPYVIRYFKQVNT